MTGDPVDASRAQALGLVNRVVPAERLLDEALALAGRIAENAPLAVRYSKEVMRRASELPEDEAWTINDSTFGAVFGSAGAIEDRLRSPKSDRHAGRDARPPGCSHQPSTDCGSACTSWRPRCGWAARS